MKTLPRLDRVLVVAKRSAYDNYVRRYRNARVKQLLRDGDPVVTRLVRADRDHRETIAEVRAALLALRVRATFRDRSTVARMTGFDLVITVGGDGTLLGASHGVADTPIVGINSAPDDSVGYLCALRKGGVEKHLRAWAEGRIKPVALARMSVRVDGEIVHNRVLNDVLFSHRSPAMTTRYFLRFRGVREEQKSSGVWIGPATGSTAAIRSAGGHVLPPTSRQLQFIVREPYTPSGRAFRWSKGLVQPEESVEIWNKMREACLYIDGPRNVVPLEIGQRVRFEASDEPLWMAGTHRRPSAASR